MNKKALRESVTKLREENEFLKSQIMLNLDALIREIKRIKGEINNG
jgi:hypothetical protein